MARAAEPGPTLSFAAGVPITLEDLIRERVTLEWEDRADQAAAAGRPLVHYPYDAARHGLRTLEDAIALALDGFHRNAFFVTVDDRQVTALDAPITLTPATMITFIRLVPLVSG
ncbi:hypothetical protein [Plastoroseomonas arctica]|uniref:Uncharacterized protein n=1 Tax=Plastoroseomonas arctica TaxID=1509237 RepID=A0AAF1K0U4_9PROT|nr:hypothetical protein [Plastoroseomonas arctica]MBR0656948.1 hypothetical protein [Plastoroseomonas arctica]